MLPFFTPTFRLCGGAFLGLLRSLRHMLKIPAHATA